MIPELSLLDAQAGGLILLGVSGDLLIRGAEGFSQKLGLSPLWVGIFVIGIGTSAPELVISLKAALENAPGLAVGNIVGSNIANILLVPVLPALLVTVDLYCRKQMLALLAMLLATAAWCAAIVLAMLTFMTGVWLLVALLSYTVILVITLRDAPEEDEDTEPAPAFGLTLFFIIIGLVGLPLGAHLAITGGAGIASELGIIQAIIGLTVLEVGTSLPEVFAATAAAFRRQSDMLVGNILGSNTFIVLAAGGFISLFGPIDMDGRFLNYDLWVMAAAAILLTILIIFRMKVTRLGGLILGALYLAYIAGVALGWNILEVWERVLSG